MGLLDNIKKEAAKSGQNKGKIFFVKDGEKKRVRFLNDMDDGMEVTFHDSFEAGINVPCQEVFDRECPYCEEEGLRTRSQYIWSVWDYDAAEVKLFMYPVNNCSPIPALAQIYETYGTLTDRDYVISVTGKQQNKTFGVVPMDKNRFKNAKAKPFSESKVLSILDKAYPDENRPVEDEDDEPVRNKKKGNASVNKGSKVSSKKDEDWDEDEEDEEEEIDYSDMSAKELYKLCKEREIDVLPKKPEKYYIHKLEEYDQANDDWADEDEEEDEDDWED